MKYLILAIVGLCLAGCQSNRVNVLFFSMPGCGPCHAMENGVLNDPNVEKWINKTGHLTKVGYSDGTTIQKYGINCYPTVVFEKDGEEVDRLIGSLGPENFLAFLERCDTKEPSKKK